MYESCLAVGTIAADDRDSLADVSFDPLTVAYDDDEDEDAEDDAADDDTKGEEANEDADKPPRLATPTRPSKLPAAKLPYVRTPPRPTPTYWWFFNPYP
jgi:hypothetical protein